MFRTLKLKKIPPALKKKPLDHLLKHLNQQSIKKIQKRFNGRQKFAFRQLQQDGVLRFIKKLPKNKVVTFNNIPVKKCSTRFTYTLKLSRKIFGDCKKSGNFSDIFDMLLEHPYSILNIFEVS